MKLLKSVLGIQKGGKHYKGLAIQPVEIAKANNLCFRVFSALKYMFRHDKPGGERVLDIKKAIHYLQILLEQEYEVYSNIEYSDDIQNINDEPDELKNHDDECFSDGEDDNHDYEHIHRNSK